MMVKSCELCFKARAKMHCESDQASLCWDCDAKVHSANFLVARHTRRLLCRVCQSPTPWTAAGTKLGTTVSVCENCVEESRIGNDNEFDSEHDDFDDDDSDDDDEEEEEDGDNQVVPWSSTPPPVSASSSNNEESDDNCRDVSLKRRRENVAHLPSNDDDDENIHSAPLVSAARTSGIEDAADVDSMSSRPWKIRKLEPNRLGPVHDGLAGSRSMAIAELLRRFHEQIESKGAEMSATVGGICRMSKGPEAVDLDSSESS